MRRTGIHNYRETGARARVRVCVCVCVCVHAYARVRMYEGVGGVREGVGGCNYILRETDGDT